MLGYISHHLLYFKQEQPAGVVCGGCGMGYGGWKMGKGYGA